MSNPFALNKIDPRTGALVPVPAYERVRALLDTPNPEELVPQIDIQSFYELVTDAGLDEAWELLALATPDQLVAFVDFDGWKGYDLDQKKFGDWLDIVLQLPDKQFKNLWESMDPELATLWLRTHTQILIWEDDEDLIDAIDGPVATSPDGVFAIFFKDEEADGPLVKHLLDRVYSLGIKAGHRLLEASRWELNSQLNDEALKAREIRLQELGYAPLDESVEVYAWLDPTVWVPRIQERARKASATELITLVGKLPPYEFHLRRLEEDSQSDNPSILARALSALPNLWGPDEVEAVIDAILSQHRALINRVLIADEGQIGDRLFAQTAAQRAEGLLEVGLGLTAEDDIGLAAAIISTVPLKTIHQLGYSATAKLQSEAKRWVASGTLGLIEGQPLSLLSADERSLIDGLLRKRPALDSDGLKMFKSHQDVERGAVALRDIAAQAMLMSELLQWDQASMTSWSEQAATSGADQVTFRSLIMTGFMRQLQHGSEQTPQPEPLEYRDAIELLGRWSDKDAVEDTLEDICGAFIERFSELQPGLRPALMAFLQSARLWFVDGLAEPPALTPQEALSALLLLR